MKRCPECRRDYYDDTLSFCLDDGAPLLDGPASDEPATAILSEPGAAATRFPREEISSEGATRLISHPSPGSIASKRNLIVAAAVGIAVVTALGIGSYLYYGRGPTKQIQSIAVMPFVNESGNPDVDYLSDGMTETLINSLTQLPNLNVKPRTSAFRYKGRESEAKTIGSELDVGAILNGRLVQRGDEITLFLSLIDTGTENQIWGKQYSRKLANLLALQTEVARDVSENLRTKLTGVDEQRLAKNYTASPEAYRLYLQGRFFWNKRKLKDMGKAIGYFQQAISVDPNYALAWAGLADATAQPSDIVPHHERAEKARAAALKALSLDNDLAEAHTALAHILTRYDLDFDGAERELRRSLELDPNWADTYQRYGELYGFLGRYEESLAKFRQGLDVEPFCIPCGSSYGGALIAAGRYDDAITQFKKTLELDPTFSPAHNGLSTAYRLKGMYAESVEEYAKFLELRSEAQAAARLRESFAISGWKGFLRAEYARYTSDLRSIERSSYYGEAVRLAELGENDNAFTALSRSYENRENPALVFLKTDRRLDTLRDDPRFQELLKRVGFPE